MLEEDLNKISCNTDPDLFEGYLKVIWERVVLPQFHRHIDTKPTKIKNYYDILQVGSFGYLDQLIDKLHLKYS